MSLPGQVFHVLLLEDSDADVYLFRRALERAGLSCDLTILSDGEEGLAYALHEGKYRGAVIPDLAILDINLPRGSGATVLEAMRRNELLTGVPVAIVTSSGAPREQARAKELGVDCFLTKPADLEAFLDLGFVLKKILLQSRAAKEGPAQRRSVTASSQSSVV